MSDFNEVILKVMEARQDDIDKGIIRIDGQSMRDLNAKPGDVVELEGGRSSVSIIARSYPADVGLGIVRMDGLTRRNSKTSIGEVIKLRLVKAKPAQKVVIAPAQKGVQIQVMGQPTAIKRALLGRPVVKGDIITLGGTNTRRRTFSGSPFEEIFRMFEGDPFMGVPFHFAGMKFVVVGTSNKVPVIITDKTEVVLKPEAAEVSDEKIPDVSYEDIGGLGEELRKVREIVETPLKHPEIFQRLGIEAPKGVLLYGPPGTGKTLLAKAVANEANAHFININGPEVMNKWVGEAEKKLRKVFEDAEENSPTIIFIDEIDSIAPKREEVTGEVERRVVAQLLALMDGLKARGKVIVIAATNRENSIDPALRRPGRFDREIEIGVPDKEARLEIFKIHTRNMPIQPDYDLTNLKTVFENLIAEANKSIIDLKKDQKTDESSLGSDSVKKVLERKEKSLKVLNQIFDKISGLKESVFEKQIMSSNSSLFSNDDKNKILEVLLENLYSGFSRVTHGFVGADIEAVGKEAAMIALRRFLPEIKAYEAKEEGIPNELLEKIIVTEKDFKEALKQVSPSAMREVMIEIPNVNYSDIGGLTGVVRDLKESVEWPIKFPESFKRLGIKPPKGILLYGPPGCGKTLLAKAVAKESEANFISIKGPELISKWVGDSEKAIRAIFKKARQVSPAVIFFDELDSIASRRGSGDGNRVGESVVNQLLTEMDGMQGLEDVVVIAASNRPDMIDEALLRPGRFDKLIHVPAPDLEARKKVFEVHLKNVPLEGSVDIERLARKTDGFSGADIGGLVRDAAINVIRKDKDAEKVPVMELESVLKDAKSSISYELVEFYKNFTNRLQKKQVKESMSYLG